MNRTKTGTSWRLADGEALAARNPYTFHKPSTEAVAALRPGDAVKLVFELQSGDTAAPNAERMWVQIASRCGDSFEGLLDNSPVYMRDLACGDPVTFQARHIIQVNIDDPVPSPTAKYEARCFVTRAVLYDGAPIGYLYREVPEFDDDSGWRIAAGTETDEYMDDSANICWISLGAILREDDSIIDLLDEAPGTAFLRYDGDDHFTRLEN